MRKAGQVWGRASRGNNYGKRPGGFEGRGVSVEAAEWTEAPSALLKSSDFILRAQRSYRKIWGSRVMWLPYGGRIRSQRGEGG